MPPYKKIISIILILCFLSCTSNEGFKAPLWNKYSEKALLEANADHRNRRMRYKLIQSKHLDKQSIWNTISAQLNGFDESQYNTLKKFILEKSIPELQENIASNSLSYEKLTQWYLYRILKLENDSTKTLHSIISINPNAVAEAKQKDKNRKQSIHPIFGMPILVKDNINTEGMKTTAGAYALKDHSPGDAPIVKNLKSMGGIVLGKVNLSEWAYYFCDNCPLGYSAIGGQTLNPYGRMRFETGGSSSGSGVSVAANYAVAAIGTETSGSILSPSSKNSVVGMKPTVGTLSGQGIVPISKTLDTAGPMTRSVKDNAILFYALKAENVDLVLDEMEKTDLSAFRFAAFETLADNDSLYKLNIELLKKQGAEIIYVENPDFDYSGFLSLLNIDMKEDIPNYLQEFAADDFKPRSIEDLISFNRQDSSAYMPYGQGRFEAIVADSITSDSFALLKSELMKRGRDFFESIMADENIDALISINNNHAGPAAVSHYPCITVPMGYRNDGEPTGITYISPPGEEISLLKIAYAFEKVSNHRRIPEAFD